MWVTYSPCWPNRHSWNRPACWSAFSHACTRRLAGARPSLGTASTGAAGSTILTSRQSRSFQTSLLSSNSNCWRWRAPQKSPAKPPRSFWGCSCGRPQLALSSGLTWRHYTRTCTASAALCTACVQTCGSIFCTHSRLRQSLLAPPQASGSPWEARFCKSRVPI